MRYIYVLTGNVLSLSLYKLDGVVGTTGNVGRVTHIGPKVSRCLWDHDQNVAVNLNVR